MSRIVLDAVSKQFPDGTTAVSALDLEVADGELLVLVGPSGCGKTTALRMVAGLEEVSSGTIFIDDNPVNDLEPRHRDVAMVFQSYALYPHLSVYDNMAFSLKYRKVPKSEVKQRVDEAARILELEPYLRAQAPAAVRRAAPAGGHGPGHRAPAAGVPDGRAAVQPGRQAPGADARRDRPAAALARHHHHLRHARPDRGDDAGQPGRGAPAGRPAADSLAAGAVPAAREPVRGRVHRVAADEPDRREVGTGPDRTRAAGRLRRHTLGIPAPVTRGAPGAGAYLGRDDRVRGPARAPLATRRWCPAPIRPPWSSCRSGCARNSAPRCTSTAGSARSPITRTRPRK